MSKKSRRRDQDETKSWTLDAPTDELLALFGAGTITASGEFVGPESAMRVPAVAAAVRTIAETIASLPIHCFRRDDDGGRTRDREHPAAKVLERPAPWLSGYDFKLALVMDSIRHGRGIAVAARGGGEVRELHRLPFGLLRIEHDTYTGAPSYVFAPPGAAERRYSFADVVDIVPVPADSGSASAPPSLISLGREAIAFAGILQKHGSRLFANGARPSGLISFEGKVTAEQIRSRLAIWNAAHGGGKTGGTAALDQKAQYTALTLNSVDAQFLELWRFAILEIARLFRLPPHMLAEMDRTTHANAEEMALQFISYTLRPWLDLIEGALTRVLIGEDDRDTHFLEFQLDDLTRGNIAARFKALQLAVGGPFLTSNEARAIENRPALPEGDTLNQPQGVGPSPDDGDDAPAAGDPPTPANLPRVPRIAA